MLRKDIQQWNKNLMQLDTCVFREKCNTLGMEANVMEISQRREKFWIKIREKDKIRALVYEVYNPKNGSSNKREEIE